MNTEDCVIVCQSKSDEPGDPRWMTLLHWPAKELEPDAWQHVRDFMLLIMVVEEAEFTWDGKMVKANLDRCNGLPMYHALICDILETDFQGILLKLIHEDWDAFHLTWVPKGWPIPDLPGNVVIRQ